MAGFSRSRTVTVRLTSCRYLYLCFCSRPATGMGNGRHTNHKPVLCSRGRGEGGTEDTPIINQLYTWLRETARSNPHLDRKWVPVRVKQW